MDNNMDKKIDKDAELSEEELNMVNGGRAKETSDDSKFLNKLANLCDRYGSGMAYWSTEVGKEVTEAWSKVGVRFVKDDYQSNKYFINGKQVSQNEAMEHAMRVIGRRISPDEWK